MDPRCTPQAPEHCGGLGCSSDADCASPVDCGDGVCLDFECFVRVDDGRCGAQMVCDSIGGCVLEPGADAGPGCPPTETSCVEQWIRPS